MKKMIFNFMVVLAFLLVSSYSASQVKQNCTVKSRSQCGIPTTCDSNTPLPLEGDATIKLSKKIWWNGFDSWEFAIENAKGKFTKLNGFCMQGQSQGGQYGEGANITVHFVCNSLPRELEKGDKIWMYVFSDQKNPDYWLMMNIPIQGITNQGPTEKLQSSEIEKKRSNLSQFLLQKLNIWSSKRIAKQTQK